MRDPASLTMPPILASLATRAGVDVTGGGFAAFGDGVTERDARRSSASQSALVVPLPFQAAPWILRLRAR